MAILTTETVRSDLGEPTQVTNVNTVSYWDARFGSGDWESRGGYSQTRRFAMAQIPRLRIDPSFTGKLCDFGCGAGDAFPVYREAYPSAELVGVDFSGPAIDLCQKKFGTFASFVRGVASDVPESDVILSSNVLEHLDDDIAVVETLRERCRRLIVIVPYEERPLHEEHVRRYSRDTFADQRPLRSEVFLSPGWTEYGLSLVKTIYLGNAVRLLAGKVLKTRGRQILFEFDGRLP